MWILAKYQHQCYCCALQQKPIDICHFLVHLARLRQICLLYETACDVYRPYPARLYVVMVECEYFELGEVVNHGNIGTEGLIIIYVKMQKFPYTSQSWIL